MKLSENCYKLENTANPISPNVFCAAHMQYGIHDHKNSP